MWITQRQSTLIPSDSWWLLEISGDSIWLLVTPSDNLMSACLIFIIALCDSCGNVDSWILRVISYVSWWQPVTACVSWWQLDSVGDTLWQLMTACNSLWQLMTAGDSWWQPVTACDSWWQPVTACVSRWQPVTAGDSRGKWLCPGGYISPPPPTILFILIEHCSGSPAVWYMDNSSSRTAHYHQPTLLHTRVTVYRLKSVSQSKKILNIEYINMVWFSSHLTWTCIPKLSIVLTNKHVVAQYRIIDFTKRIMKFSRNILQPP